MMRYKLVIAEKPSVAQSLAAVIGATARKDGYLEGNGWRVSWCVGHLAGLADADSYDPKYAKWRYSSAEGAVALKEKITDKLHNFIVAENYEAIFSISIGVIDAETFCDGTEE